MSEKVYTLRSAAVALNKSEQYLRKCVREGKLESTLVQVGASKIKRHEISASALEAFQNRSGARTSREDGRNKFVVYLTGEEYDELAATISEKAYADLLTRANPTKVAVEA